MIERNHVFVLFGCAALTACASVGTPMSPLSPVRIADSFPHPDAVVVSQGETLNMIARKHGIPVKDIIFINELESDRVVQGQLLFLPE